MAARERTRMAAERARTTSRPKFQISRPLIESFAETMREKLTSGTIPFRKAYIGAILDRVEVDDCAIRLIGGKEVLEQAVISEGALQPRVRSFARKWRTRQDSNL